MRIVVLIYLIFLTSACSLYQSEGRKYLEKNAYEFAGVSAEANAVGCTESAETTNWERSNETLLAEVYTPENGAFALRVFPKSAGEAISFACDFQFSSAQELLEKTSAAIDLTISRWTMTQASPSSTAAGLQ